MHEGKRQFYKSQVKLLTGSSAVEPEVSLLTLFCVSVAVAYLLDVPARPLE